MLRWTISKKILELKYTWKISRNASDTKTNLFVEVSDEINKGNGEAAPNVRYNESREELEKQFRDFLSSVPENISSIYHLNEILNPLPLFNALKFAIESAYVHYICMRERKTFFEMLDVMPPQSIHTAYSIPIMEIGAMKKFYQENKLSRFRFIKIKVNEEEGLDAVNHLSSFCDQPLIVDANEAFKDVEQCISFLEKIKGKSRSFGIELIEQPMPSSMPDEMIYLKKYSPFKLFADESITSIADFSQLKKMFDGVNIKLMKAGGYLNGIRLLKDAKANGMQTMIGCMVETTLGISSGMNLCSLVDYVDLDSFLVVKNEPFNLIEEKNGELKFNSEK